MSKIITLIFGVVLCTSFTQAQTSQIADTLELDGITVTASKIPLSARETTKPVVVIDQSILARSGGKSLSQVLDEQAGILVNGSFSNPGLNKNLFIQGASNKYTLFLIDGLAVQDPNGFGGASDLRNIALDNIERIEVVKGSMSTLYGTDAIAGVVNIITKKPQSKSVQINGIASYGSYNSYRTAIGANGTVDGGSYSINFSREETDGISEAQDTLSNQEREDLDLQEFDNDGFERNSINIRATVNPVEGLSITPFFNYSAFDGGYDSGAFTDGTQTYESNLFNPGISLSYINGGLEINSGYNFTGTDYAFIDPVFPTEYEGKLQNFDTYAAYSINPNIKALAGFNYQNMKIGGTGNIVENPNSEIYSPYFTAIMAGLNNVSVEAGVRLNNHSEFGNHLTYSLSGAYSLMDMLKLVTSFGTGFRAPSLQELFGPFGANPNLEPEKSIYLNAGFESYLMDDQLKIGFNAFARNIDNVITTNSLFEYVNQNEQNDYGFELTTNYIINPKITVRGNYNYLTGELTTLDFEGNEVKVDNLIRRPEHSIGFGVLLNPIPELSVSLDGAYVGERTDLWYNPATFTSSEVTLDSYFHLNIYAEYQLMDGLFSVFADAKNLTNADYYEVFGYTPLDFTVSTGVKLNWK